MKYKVGDKVITNDDWDWDDKYRNKIVTIKSVEKRKHDHYYLMQELDTEWYDEDIQGLAQPYLQREEAKKLFRTKMSKFKVGDKIVIIDNGDLLVKDIVGVTGTISDLDNLLGYTRVKCIDWSDGKGGYMPENQIDFLYKQEQQKEAKKLLGLK